MPEDPAISVGVSQRVRAQLSRIFAPMEMATPPADAMRELMVLPSGQIRHYGFRGSRHAARRIYIASDDCGLSWQEYDTPPGVPGAVTQSPWSDDFLTILGTHELPAELDRRSIVSGLDHGLWLFRSTSGVDGDYSVRQVIAGLKFILPRQPMALRHRQRWIVACQWIDPQHRLHPVVLWSDDDGQQWYTVILPAGPRHEPVWPHKGVRWQNFGCEPTIVELSTGRLWMIFRTSTDTHYESFSDDGGETWTTPGPSRFYGTITMPTLFRLSDGRMIFFWCNTTPLPELDHDQQPELDKRERDGWGEDFFTNRDAFHAAISDNDGKTWKGFREIRLSPIRNNADYRSLGGNDATLDKSMHQSQAVELLTGHVLVSHGQHPMCRRIVIFHPSWLYEQQRSEDFQYGLGNVSSFQYVKSIAGNFRDRSGHCAYNRRSGPLLLPSPDGERREVLHLGVYRDERLVHPAQGVVWNFPATFAGELKIELRLARGTAGVRICLADRWFNPVDPVVSHLATYTAEIAMSNCPPDTWQTVTLCWKDARSAAAQLNVANQEQALPLKVPSVNGLSYLHIQTLAPEEDTAGVYLRSFHARGDLDLSE